MTFAGTPSRRSVSPSSPVGTVTGANPAQMKHALQDFAKGGIVFDDQDRRSHASRECKMARHGAAADSGQILRAEAAGSA